MDLVTVSNSEKLVQLRSLASACLLCHSSSTKGRETAPQLYVGLISLSCLSRLANW